METAGLETYSEEYYKYLQNRSGARKFVRKLYLSDIKRYCLGRTLDFGCGVGELLKILPKGSRGYEVNKVLVDSCQKSGLPIFFYDAEKDNYRFEDIEHGYYGSFTMNHVLEHLENSSEVIDKIFSACSRLGIKRIVFTVPGYKGFLSDKTHLTFIDEDYFMNNGLFDNKYYQLRKLKYFPFNIKLISKIFIHNELRIVFDERVH